MLSVRLFLACIICLHFSVRAQDAPTIQQVHNTKGSLRGMSIPDDQTIWVTGSDGTVTRSIDGGVTWMDITVPGYEKSDFRDVEAFDANNAIIMGVTQPAVLLQTRDGGKTWKEIYRDTARLAFLDAMSFNRNMEGIVVGDPLNGTDYKLWVEAKQGRVTKLNGIEKYVNGESFFAGSGTNVSILKDKSTDYAYVTGGLVSRYYLERKSSRLYVQGDFIELPFTKGKSTAGANSLSSIENRFMVVVGGDFEKPNDTTANCFYSITGGKQWLAPVKKPGGYRSCVEHLAKDFLVTCGINGVDVSDDGGVTWNPVTKEGFHVVQRSRTGSAVFLAGSRGRIAKLTWEF